MSPGERCMSHSPVPIFILGSGRSGTTVIASLVNRLPGVHIANETGFIGQSVELLREIAKPESRRRLIEVVNSWLVIEQWTGRASEKGFEDFCQQHQLSGPAAFIHYVWQIDSPVPWEQLNFIGDNTPLYVFSIPWLLELFPDARFVHVVRDPRDVVCSMMSMRFGADDPVVAAVEWNHAFGCWLMAERIIPPENRIEIRYEDLCFSAEETKGKLTAFLKTEYPLAETIPGGDVTAEIPLSDTFRRVSTLPHHQGLTAPLNASRVGRYETELSPGDLRAIEAVVQNGMMALGYRASEWQVGPWARENRAFLTRRMFIDLIKRAWRRLRHALTRWHRK